MPVGIYAWLAVTSGAAVGAAFRYALMVVGHNVAGLPGYAAILFINVLGCLAIGIADQALHGGEGGAPLLRLFLLPGVLAGFTTFSSFALDILQLGSRVSWLPSAAYGAGSVLLSLLAVYAGGHLGRALS